MFPNRIVNLPPGRYPAVSIFGSLNVPIRIASNSSATRITVRHFDRRLLHAVHMQSLRCEPVASADHQVAAQQTGEPPQRPVRRSRVAVSEGDSLCISCYSSSDTLFEFSSLRPALRPNAFTLSRNARSIRTPLWLLANPSFSFLEVT